MGFTIRGMASWQLPRSLHRARSSTPLLESFPDALGHTRHATSRRLFSLLIHSAFSPSLQDKNSNSDHLPYAHRAQLTPKAGVTVLVDG